MCGIFALLNYNEITPKIKECFENGVNRGPENSSLELYNNTIIGFHRLAINGLNELSNQPFKMDGLILICNGEIYNFRELAKTNNISLKTQSDCEIILHLYKIFGIEYTLNILDGVFAFFLYDTNINKCYIARDPYGVRPLFYFNEENKIGFASELKSLYNVCNNKNFINNFIPGNYMNISFDNNKILSYSSKMYTYFPCYENIFNTNLYTIIVDSLIQSVKKRVVDTTERPIGCLLSGGLDSSLIAALVNQELKLSKDKSKAKLQTFSIGLKDSEDLKYARLVANHLDTDHHEIIVLEKDFFNAIPEVIKTIESYDTTTVRASVGNYLVAKYIKMMSDCKVIFNGDGADELMGGYLYFKKAKNSFVFDYECKRLLQDIYMFDVLRSDRSISSHGLEPRTPFLDRKWVETYLSISKDIRYRSTVDNCEKYLIRSAFSDMMPELLPKEILWRKKEAFSDGVSGLNRSWFTIINENIQRLCKEDKSLQETLDKNIKDYKKIQIQNPPTTLEQSYYRYLYNKNYKGTDHLIPYYWMPRFVEAKDASARTLQVYND